MNALHGKLGFKESDDIKIDYVIFDDVRVGHVRVGGVRDDDVRVGHVRVEGVRVGEERDADILRLMKSMARWQGCHICQ
jgi:hypothetical protein